MAENTSVKVQNVGYKIIYSKIDYQGSEFPPHIHLNANYESINIC